MAKAVFVRSLSANFRVREHFAMVDFAVVILAMLSASLSIVTGDTVHLTMVTPTPYSAGSSASMTCFRSSPDASITVSFGRPFQIGLPGSTVASTTALPSGSYSSTNGQSVTRFLGNSNDAVGLFYCQGTSRGYTTSVFSIIHSINRKFVSNNGLVTRTINQGEDVTLTVASYNNLGTSPLWRRIRNGVVFTMLSQQAGYSITLPSTDVMDGDLYAVIQSAARLDDNHFSMIRLIVRGCVEGKWGQFCTGICDLCYNGGVCDDVTGECICAPGFTGTHCLNACGRHKFGWNCEFQCGPGHTIQSCRGSQFGLPDPYGNSCISGYMGTYCDTACSFGTFGAGCSQMCHCQSGTCDIYTGTCDTGCASGWSGINCQIILSVTYSFEQGIYTVTEGTDSTATVYVVRSGPHTTPDSSVVVMSSDATATAGTDYIGASVILNFGASFNQVAVTMSIVDDSTEQYTLRCFTLALSNPNPSSGILGSSTQVCIIDDDNIFGGTCPPPESLSVIESNEEPVIEASTTTGNGVAISWTNPTLYTAMFSSVFNCYQTTSPNYLCNSGDVFPITTMLQDYGGRILVDYLVLRTVSSPAVSCRFYIRVSDFRITCAPGVAVYGNPGSTISVTIPSPTVSGGVSGVTLYYRYPQDMNYKLITTQLQVAVPASGTDSVNVEVLAVDHENEQRSCTYSLTVIGFGITCAPGDPVYGNPGSTISVMIPPPTVSGGVSGVIFQYRDPQDNMLKPLNTQLQVTVPVGTRIVNVEVLAMGPANQQPSCMYSFTVTGFDISCATGVVVYGNPGSTISVMIPPPTVSGGVSGVTFQYRDPQDNMLKPLTTQLQVTLTVGTRIVNVELLAMGPANEQQSCMYSFTVTGFDITCATGVPVYGNPGSTISVMIPPPTVSGGVSGVTFQYIDPQDNMLKPLTTQLQVTVPVSRSDTVNVEVFTFSPQQRSCMYSFTVTGVPYLSQQPIVSTTSTSANISWLAWGINLLDTGSGPIIQYNVYYSNSSTSPIAWMNAGSIPVTDSSQSMYSFIVSALDPDTQYTFSVAAVGPGGEGPHSPNAIKMTLPPVPTTEGITTIESTTSVSTGDITTIESTSGAPQSPVALIAVPVAVVLALLVVILILVAVLIRRVQGKRSKEVLGPGLNNKYDNDLVSLQTIENPVMASTEDITSNGDTINETSDRPLSSTSQISTLDPSSPYAGLPFYPSGEREYRKDPIPVKDFPAYVRDSIQRGQLIDEWTSFPGIEPMCSCDVSQEPDNKSKNRYRNIPAYDHCRVILKTREGATFTDYINASYIKGYMNDRAYIATQGPSKATAPYFWRMVWQENVHVIVNGTNLVEDGKSKCVQYWPDLGASEFMGDVNIELLDEQNRGQYTVRVMKVVNVVDCDTKPRKVTQFHYTSWPDKDVPKDVTPVLNFCQEFSAASPKDSGPYLIHCSAGVGRTGAIIGIHASLQRAQAEKNVDIYNFVAAMRDHRVSIVQTSSQYTFIHLAVLEKLFSTNTCTPAPELKKKISELKKKKNLASEFEQLDLITPVPSRERCRNSLAVENEDKNRYMNTLISEGCRPYLMTPREDGIEYNYINAAFIDGFKSRNIGIVTQSPMPNTVLDLWRLVYDYQITCIVMLNALDPTDPSCPTYWPDAYSQDYGPFRVSNVKVDDFGGYNVKQLELLHRKQKRKHYLKHYQVTDWSIDQEVPQSPHTILRLILNVEGDIVEGKRCPVLVHCIDGLNRSGVFCVLKNCLDRLREDNMVDIMQTTKLLRLNRPYMLNEQSLYMFCYEAMQAYISEPNRFKDAEPIYQNMPTKQQETQDENIYQNLKPTAETSDA